MQSTSRSAAIQGRRERSKARVSPAQTSLPLPSEMADGGDNTYGFEEFDVDDQLWSRDGYGTAQTRGFRGKSMNAWMLLGISCALLTGGLAVLATVCFSSHRSWVPSEALIDEVLEKNVASLAPKPLSTINATMWWLAIVGTVIGNFGILLFQVRTPRWTLLYAVTTAVLAGAQLVVTLVILVQSVSFTSATATTGGLPQLRSSLTVMWNGLTQTTSGSQALCAIQQQLKCSGITTCCITNSSPVADALMGDAYQHFCFISYDNGSLMNESGADIRSVVERECGYLALYDSCALPTTLGTCLGPMEGALMAPYGFGLTAHCTWAALLFVLSYFAVGLTRLRARAAYVSHVNVVTNSLGARSAFDENEDYDPYAY